MNLQEKCCLAKLAAAASCIPDARLECKAGNDVDFRQLDRSFVGLNGVEMMDEIPVENFVDLQ